MWKLQDLFTYCKIYGCPFVNIIDERINWIGLGWIRINYRSQVLVSVTECWNICWTPGFSQKGPIISWLSVRASVCPWMCGSDWNQSWLESAHQFFFLKFDTMILKVKKTGKGRIKVGVMQESFRRR